MEIYYYEVSGPITTPIDGLSTYGTIDKGFITAIDFDEAYDAVRRIFSADASAIELKRAN